MKSNFLALALVAAAALAPLSARADDEVSLETFYDNLAPYGEWIEVGGYGDCWHPTGVDAEWAPYTDGYWSYTDAGWTWVSYEEFGDITYHYGRWVSVDDVGWCWVPDTEWGPAWVSWRQDDEYVGWAPLPPEARWRQDVGFSVWVDDSYDIGPEYYNFCPVIEFSAPVIRHVCVPRVSVVSIFARSVNITNISWNGYRNHVFCGGPNYSVISTRLRRPIPALKLVHNTTVINNNVTIINNRRVVKFPHGRVQGNTLNVFAPKVVRKDVTKINRPHIARVVQKEKVNRGWKLQNQGEVAKLREKVKKETKGLTPDTSPARPVQVADLKPVPEKADLKAPSPVAGRGDGRGKGPNGNNDNKPDRAVADRPGRGNGNAGNDNRPDRPGKADGDRPDRGAVATDEPDRSGADQGKQKKIAGEKPDRDNADRPARDTGGNPVVRPFNDPSRDNRPEAGIAKKQGGDDNDGAAQAERQRKAAAEQSAERQRRAAEMYSERQRAAAEARQRQRQAALQGNEGGERAERPPQPQRDQGERQQQQQQQQQYQRQQLQQRQAQEQQRQLQAQRQQQLQRQFQQQQAQKQQGGGGGGVQPKQPAQGQGNGKGRQLTPEEKAALQKQRGY